MVFVRIEAQWRSAWTYFKRLECGASERYAVGTIDRFVTYGRSHIKVLHGGMPGTRVINVQLDVSSRLCRACCVTPPKRLFMLELFSWMSRNSGFPLGIQLSQNTVL